jgi:hypothetical protein
MVPWRRKDFAAHMPAKACPALDAGWIPVGDKDMRKQMNLIRDNTPPRCVTSPQVLERQPFVVALGGVRAKTTRGREWSMVRVLELAVEALGRLPAADQERMGRQLLTYIEKLVRLRVEIDQGVGALDPAAAVPLDVEDFLQRQNERHGRA